VIKSKIFQFWMLFTLLLLNIFGSYSNSGIYSYANPKHEIDDAEVLQYDITVIINSKNSAEYTVYNKILIKAQSAEDYCKVIIEESDFRSVTNIEASIKDMDGKQIKELDENEINEAELSPGFVLYSGNKYKWFSLTASEYPYILEYSYTVELESLFFWPDWYPQRKIKCLSSTYKLILKENVEFDYFRIGVEVDPKKYLINSDQVYEWNLENIPALIEEDYMLPENHRQIALLFNAKKFVLGGYWGDFSSWESMAKWYKSLTSGKYNLSAEAVAEYKNLVKNIPDDKSKVKALYEYLQTQNRYVAIQLGLSGWQPQNAVDVYKNRYGDCKDLSTLMVAMLDAVGIKSYPALALTRDDGLVLKDFPSNQFNHCITYVPLNGDTIWLECTSSYADMEDTPYSIEDIYVLAINEDAGELIKTTKKSASENSWNSSVSGELTTKGELIFDAVISLDGNQENYYKSKLIKYDSQEDILFLKDQLGRVHSNLDIISYNIEMPVDRSGKYVLNVKGVYNKFNPKRAKRIFISPNVFNKKTVESLPEESVEEREFSIFYYYPYLDVDTVNIEIPKSFKAAYIPESVKLATSFGKFSSEYSFNDGSIQYIRTLEISKNIIPVSEYEAYVSFLKDIIKADKEKYVFVR